MKILKSIVTPVAGILLGLMLLHFLLTGYLYPKRIVEELSDPVEVAHVTNEGLMTVDGNVIPLKHVASIPTESAVLNAAIHRGVEVDRDGNAFGLVKIHHWCGNDPVRYHLAKVNLSNLVLATDGQPDQSLPEEVLSMIGTQAGDFRYGESGLDIGVFYRMRHISRIIELLRRE